MTKNVLLFLMILYTAGVAAQQTLPWYHDIQAAFQDAQKTGRLLFVDVYTEWCSWCKKLDKETFQDEKFKEISAKFVLLKVDGDKELDFCTKYKVRAYPTMLILKADGQEVHRIKGFLPASELVPILQKILEENRAELLWYTNISEAFRVAQSFNRILFVDFYTDWCGWCKKLDAETFSHEDFKKEAVRFVLLKVNGDKEVEFKKKYEIRYYPTMLFLKPNGEEIKRLIGFMTADKLVPIMKEIGK